MEIRTRVSKDEKDEVVQRHQKNDSNCGQIDLGKNQVKGGETYSLKSLKSHEKEILRRIEAPGNLFCHMLRNNKNSNRGK